jgi:DNA-binding NarL/FixJ family response regulator
VVDDYEPWRRFVLTTLQKQPELQVIGEASDGLEAIQKAEELKSDLIVLDIGLPTLWDRSRSTNPQAVARIQDTFYQPRIVCRCGSRSSRLGGAGLRRRD